MILAEKIITLRKRMDWSQEELAEKLDISRQSVSKWEVGATIPDLDKILKMSELFGVSTDYLLKDGIEQAEVMGKDVPEGRTVSVEEANAYMDTAEEVCGKIATAVSLFILSPVCLIQMAAMYAGSMLEDRMVIFGVVILLVIVAIGVAICIYNDSKLEKFKYLSKETFSLQYGVEGIVEKRKSASENKHRAFTIIGVVLCIVSAVPLLITSVFTENEVALIESVIILLIMIAAGVHLFVRKSIVEESFNQLLQCEEFTAENKEADRRMSFFRKTYWLVVTAAFLAYNFITDDWGSSWIIWPVAGVLYAAIYGILKEVMKKK